MLISTSEMDLTSIVLNVNETIANSSITIKSQTNTTNLKIGLPTGRIYQAFEVTATGINNQNIINSTFNFKINKTWLGENNITIHFKKDSYWLIENGIVGNIKLYRLPTGVNDWTPLTTSFSKQDEKYYYFYATSSGFSTFVIFFNKHDCLPGSARCSGNQVQLCLGNATWLTTEQCSYSCKDGTCSSASFNEMLITIAGVIIVGAIVIYLILVNYRRKKKKKEEKILEKFSSQKISLFQKIKRNFRKYKKEREEKRIAMAITLHNLKMEERRMHLQEQNMQIRKSEKRKEELKERRRETKTKIRKFFNSLKPILQKLNLVQKIKAEFRNYQKEREKKGTLRKEAWQKKMIEKKQAQTNEKIEQNRRLKEIREIRIKNKAKIRNFFNSLKSILQKLNPVTKIKSGFARYQRKREEKKMLKEIELQKRKIEQKRIQLQEQHKQIRELKERKKKIKSTKFTLNRREEIKRRNIEEKYRIERLNQLREKINRDKK